MKLLITTSDSFVPETNALDADAESGSPGESAWFVENVLIHDDALRRYVRNRFGPTDADDIVQDSYLRIWRARLRRLIRSNVRSLLFTVARNAALDLVRRRNRAPFVPLELAACEVPAVGDVRDHANCRQRWDIVREAIAQLPSRSRVALQLHGLQGLSYEETASRMGVTPATANSQVLKATRRCAQYVQDRYSE